MTGKVTSLYDSKAAGQTVDLINATTTDIEKLKKQAEDAAKQSELSAVSAQKAADSMKGLTVNGLGVTYDPVSNTISLPTIKGEPGNTGPQGKSVDFRLAMNGDFYKIVDGVETLVSNIKGAKGEDGHDGANGVNGVSVQSVANLNGDLVVGLDNGVTYNLGKFQGADGADGNIVTANVDAAGNFTVNDGTTITTTNIRGPMGPKGADAQSVEAFQVFWTAKTIQGQSTYVVPGLAPQQKTVVFLDGLSLTINDDYVVVNGSITLQFAPMGDQNFAVYSFGKLFGGTLNANDVEYTGMPRLDITSNVVNQALFDLDMRKVSAELTTDQVMKGKLKAPTVEATALKATNFEVTDMVIQGLTTQYTENITTANSLVNKEYVDTNGVTPAQAGAGILYSGTAPAHSLSVDVLPATPLSFTTGGADGQLRLDYEKLTAVPNVPATALLTVWNGSEFVKVTKDDFMGGVAGSLRILGTWNPTTNVVTGDANNTSLNAGVAPQVAAGDNPQGVEYIIEANGTSSITGTSTSFFIGDFVLWSGTAWIRYAGQSNNLVLSDGTEAQPALRFQSATGSGLYRKPDGTVALTVAGADILRLTAGSVVTTKDFSPSTKIVNAVGTQAAPTYTFTGDTTTGFSRITTNKISWVSGNTLGGNLTRTGIELLAGVSSAPSLRWIGAGSNGVYYSVADNTIRFAVSNLDVAQLGATCVFQTVISDTTRHNWVVTPVLTVGPKNTTGPETHTVSILHEATKDKLVNFNGVASVTKDGDFVMRDLTSRTTVNQSTATSKLTVDYSNIVDPAQESIRVLNAGITKFCVKADGTVVASGTVTGATPTLDTHLATKAYVDSRHYELNTNVGTSWITVATGDGSYSISCSGFRCFMGVVGDDFTISSVLGNDTFNFDVVGGEIKLQTLSGNRATKITQL